METSEQVKQIKRSFRLFMNGVTAASMRSKGLNYKINWGVQLPDLKRMAAQYGHNAELASALWAENGAIGKPQIYFVHRTCLLKALVMCLRAGFVRCKQCSLLEQ